MEVYYADFLKKEDHAGKWRVYWTWLNATGLYFRLGKTAEGHENFQQCIEITPGSQCALAKRRMYSFRFKLVTEGVTYMFKCDSILQRYRWMYMIDLVVNGKPPESPPNAFPNSFDEKDSCKQHNAKPRNTVAKSSSLTQAFRTFKNIGSWRKKRNNSLPPARCLRKKGNISTTNCGKAPDINSSFNFAENKAFFDE